jgi:Bacterial Ig-like domain
MMKFQKMALLIVPMIVSLTACLTPTPTPPEPKPASTPTAPKIVSVDPLNDAGNIRKDTNIVVTFDQPMDKAATQAAYQSADIPSGAATFSWSDDATIMTVNPVNDLEYAKSGNLFNKVEPKIYSFSVTNTAKSASNLPLSELFSSNFKTARLLNMRLEIGSPQAWGDVHSNGKIFRGQSTIAVGDDEDGSGIRGFLTFDLPSGQLNFESKDIQDARLYVDLLKIVGTPQVDGPSGLYCSKVRVVNIYIGGLLRLATYEAENTSPKAPSDLIYLTQGYAQTTSVGSNTADVTSEVAKDFLSRLSPTGGRTQFRLQCSRQTNTDTFSDYYQFDLTTNKPFIFLSYLAK